VAHQAPKKCQQAPEKRQAHAGSGREGPYHVASREGRLRGNEAEKGAHANTKDEKPAEERTSTLVDFFVKKAKKNDMEVKESDAPSTDPPS
jgi:hypothetical protein